MKKSRIIWVLILLLVLILLPVYLHSSKKGEVCIKGECFNVEIADTPDKIAAGLMFREILPEKEGMLFVFRTECKPAFWMKNTLIPLDIVWISQENTIAYIKRDFQPCKVEICETASPESDSLYVLEINAGLSERFNFSLGDDVWIKRD